MTPDGSTKRFGPIEMTFDHTCDDMVSAALAMLAYGISKLSPAEREAHLQAIEDGGALQQAIQQSKATRSSVQR